MDLLIWLLIAVLHAAACGTLAGSRGRNVAGWTVLGFIFGVIALPLLVFLASKKVESVDSSLSLAPASSETPPTVGYDRARWASVLNQNTEVAAAAGRVSALGIKYVDQLAVAVLSHSTVVPLNRKLPFGNSANAQQSSSSPLPLPEIVAEITAQHQRDQQAFASGGLQKDLESLGGGIEYVIATPWGGIVALKSGHAVVLREDGHEILGNIGDYHIKHKNEDTTKWTELRSVQERQHFLQSFDRRWQQIRHRKLA